LLIESLPGFEVNFALNRLQPEDTIYEIVRPAILREMLTCPKDVQIVDNTCILLDNLHTQNYFHWHTQVLATYELLADIIASKELKLLMMPRSPFHWESLELAGIPSDRIVFMRPDTVYRPKRILFPSFTWNGAPPYDLDFYHAPQQAFAIFGRIRAAVRPAHSHRGRRIYVARFNAASRQMENERELADRLIGIGFEIIIAENLSFSEQVRCFAEASVVVGPHGAGLTNCVYCWPGTTVIELAHRDHRVSQVNGSKHIHHSFHHFFALQELKNALYLEHDSGSMKISSYLTYGLPVFTWNIDIEKALSFITATIGGA
jgi:capsular polysaccharide biosynthesis protein